MTSNIKSSKGIMSLSTELRMLIWEEVVSWRCVHILHGAFVRCASDGLIAGHTIKECHNHETYNDLRCSNCPEDWSMGLGRVCQLFHQELLSLRYRRTLLCFASSHYWAIFVQKRLPTNHVTGFSLSRLRRVQIEMGAAKLDSISVNAKNEAALKQLAQEATDLEVLNLNFTFYHRGESDTILLSQEILSCLLLFYQLKELNLRLYQAMPGPLGIPSLNSSLFNKILTRWKSLELVLRILTCQDFVANQPATYSITEREIAASVVSQMPQRSIKSLQKAVHSLLAHQAGRS